MAREIVIVKLGGSVATDKTKPFTYRERVVLSLGKVMATSALRIVLVHGGGSFGHTVAKRYGLSSTTYGSDAEGVAKTREAMFRLNQLICGSLLNAGVNPYTFSPFSLVANSKGAACWLNGLLDSNLTPVTFGDVISDGRGFRILSGDTMCYELSKLLHPSRCVFTIDVEGILDPKGRLMKKVDSGIVDSLRDVEAKDATGGILLKVKEAMRIASRGTQVSFVSGFSAKEFDKSLKGINFHGTIVKVA